MKETIPSKSTSPTPESVIAREAGGRAEEPRTDAGRAVRYRKGKGR